MPAYVYKNVFMGGKHKAAPPQIESGRIMLSETDQSFLGFSSLPEANTMFEEITLPEVIIKLKREHKDRPISYREEVMDGESDEYSLILKVITDEELKTYGEQLFHSLFNDTSELPYSLEYTKNVLKTKIDLYSGELRKKYISPGNSQEFVYAEKVKEAEKWNLEVTRDNINFPILSAEAEARGLTLQETVSSVIEKSAEWIKICASIEMLRMGAKLNIEQCQNMDELTIEYEKFLESFNAF